MGLMLDLFQRCCQTPRFLLILGILQRGTDETGGSGLVQREAGWLLPLSNKNFQLRIRNDVYRKFVGQLHVAETFNLGKLLILFSSVTPLM